MSATDLDTVQDRVPPWSRASDKPERRLAGLRRHLSEGIAQDGGAALRRELGLSANAEDRDVARTLVHSIAATEAPSVTISKDFRFDPRQTKEPPPVASADTSFLGRLGAEGAEGIAVHSLDDLRTLVAVVRGGRLRQRRAALLRLAERLSAGKGMPGDQVREATRALDQVRDVELAYERHHARSKLGGGIGRKARGEGEEWRKIVERVVPEVRAFWDGERDAEPILDLPGDQRAQLLMRVRDLPAVVATHLAALIEGADGVLERSERVGLLSSLRYAGDPRLVPSLRAVLEAGGSDLSLEASRALARIDDPRVRPELLSAYERSVVDSSRAVLAGGLGGVGDRRGARYVRRLLEADDPTVLIAACEALETLGTYEDGEAVAELLDYDDTQVVHQAVRTLGRLGDGRVLEALSELREAATVSALWAEIEDAEAAIRARMELRGEDVSEGVALSQQEKKSEKALAKRQDPAWVRLRSYKDYVIGRLWLFLGGIERAVRRFEEAVARRAGWAPPLVAMGLGWARAGRYPQALAAFRRAIEAERARVEGHPVWLGALTQAFLRRAEQVERDGRVDIAAGLLEEVLALDLRRAPSSTRFEIERRHAELRRRERGSGGEQA